MGSRHRFLPGRVARGGAFGAAVVVLAMSAAAAGTAEPPAFDPPVRHADLPAGVRESSGLAVSYARPGAFWTHDDSGGGAVLTRFAADGGSADTFRIQGTVNRDWEDLASFVIEGVPYLLIADTGDNGRNRPWVSVSLVREPADDADPAEPLAVIATTRFTYADGPRDAEAVALDPLTREVVIVSKEVNARAQRFGPAGLYAFPLPAPGPGIAGGPDEPDLNPGEPRVLQRLASLPAAMPTGLDLSADGRFAVLCTYGDALLFERADGRPWADVMTGTPRRVMLPPRQQGEAICFGADGRSLFLTSEKVGQPLWEVPAVITPH